VSILFFVYAIGLSIAKPSATCLRFAINAARDVLLRVRWFSRCAISPSLPSFRCILGLILDISAVFSPTQRSRVGSLRRERRRRGGRRTLHDFWLRLLCYYIFSVAAVLLGLLYLLPAACLPTSAFLLKPAHCTHLQHAGMGHGAGGPVACSPFYWTSLLFLLGGNRTALPWRLRTSSHGGCGSLHLLNISANTRFFVAALPSTRSLFRTCYLPERYPALLYVYTVPGALPCAHSRSCCLYWLADAFSPQASLLPLRCAPFSCACVVMHFVRCCTRLPVRIFHYGATAPLFRRPFSSYQPLAAYASAYCSSSPAGCNVLFLSRVWRTRSMLLLPGLYKYIIWFCARISR